ncbi:MAG: PAS domain S-box protein [Methanoregula sp.]|nr:PAS domain S-box protein [Methanoregula sp.]
MMFSLLYVDDEEMLLDLGRTFLEKEGEFSVATAESAHKGLAHLATCSVDLIISDYQMPDIDGLAFLKIVREKYPDTPFILFTGRGREEVVIEAINTGADFYLQKGGDPKAQFAELKHKIRIAIERRSAVNALRESRQRLSDIIDFLPDATFAIDTRGRVIAWNKAIEDMTGVLAIEMLGKANYEYALPFYGARRPGLVDLILKTPDEIDEFRYALISQEGGVLIAEASTARPKGKTCTILAKASLLYDKNGTIAGAIESIRDVTESKLLERALRQREAELNGIFRATPAGIGALDNGIFREVNAYFCTMTGYSHEELIGKSSRILYPSEAHYTSVDTEKNRQIPLHGIATVETHCLRKDGSIIDIFLSLAPLVAGDISKGVIFSAIDITERNKAASELLAAYEKNKGLMDSANDAIIITDIGTGMIIDANNKARQMIGRTPAEIQNMHITALYLERDKETYRKYFDQHVSEGSGVKEEIIVDCEGREITVIVSATRLEIGGRSCLMGIYHDVSEMKNAQDALKFANKKLNMLAEITRHDIRNKLTVLGGYLELLRDPPPRMQYSMYLSKLKQTLLAISENIEFTQLYENLGIVPPEWQNVHDIFYSTCAQIDIKNIRIQSDISGLEIYADPLLERVFFDMVENCLLYGAGVSVIRLSCREDAEGIVILMEDNGIGIPSLDKEKIFSKGFGKNTGFGLFLAFEILSITGITLKETGEYYQGARFEFFVPRGKFRHCPDALTDRCHIYTSGKPDSLPAGTISGGLWGKKLK